MQRAIDGFHQDEVGDWVAELRCGHGQHVRHRPPFWVREWVLTAEGRAEKIGVELPCVLCDRFEMPAGYAPYQRTRDFDQLSIPDGLRADHSTKRGVWGVIHVLAGRLRYIVEPPLASERLLERDVPGIVVPEVLHRVVPEGEVRFFVEFHRARSA
jgi:tellurite methyltransferase